MPITLQESAAFTILGDCVMHLPRDFEACCVKEKYRLLQTQAVKTKHSAKNQDSSVVLNGSLRSEDQEQSRNNRKWECDCSVLDGFLDTCKKSVVKGGNWVHFCCKPEKCFKCNVNQIPMLQHLYLDDQNVEINHCHVCKSTLTSYNLVIMIVWIIVNYFLWYCSIAYCDQLLFYFQFI
jgi:phosphatidylinositol glycan class Q protein